MLIGYMRVSTDNDRQSTDLQRDALVAAGVDARHLFEDRASGAKDSRPGLAKALDGDTPPAVRGLQPSPACTAVASHPGVWAPTPLVQFHVQPKASASKKSAVWAWNPS